MTIWETLIAFAAITAIAALVMLVDRWWRGRKR
jgi:hypothetical protein